MPGGEFRYAGLAIYHFLNNLPFTKGDKDEFNLIMITAFGLYLAIRFVYFGNFPLGQTAELSSINFLTEFFR